MKAYWARSWLGWHRERSGECADRGAGGCRGGGADRGTGSSCAQAARRRPSRLRRSRRGQAGTAGGAASAPVANGHAPSGERIFASPLARRMAKQAGIDLSGLKGSGPNGRIVRADIQAAQTGGAARRRPRRRAAGRCAPAARAVGQGDGAGHHRAAQAGAAFDDAEGHRQAAVRINRDDPAFLCVDGYRDRRHDRADGSVEREVAPKEAPGAYLITINDMVIKAAAATLRKVPAVNASWTDDGMALYDDVDISVAVSIPDGLITPIIRQADVKGLATISREMKDLAGRARAGKLKPEEFQGGGFSISNMGMFGVSAFTAIINPPQSAILAVAAGRKRPIVNKDGELAVATVMTCTLRSITGSPMGRWARTGCGPSSRWSRTR